MQLAQLIETSRKVLLLTGIWPEKNPSNFYRVKTFSTLTVNTLLLIAMSINVGYNCQNVLTISKSLYLTFSVLCGVIKELVMVFKGHTVHKLLGRFDGFSFINYLTVYNTDFKNYMKTIKIIRICFHMEVIGFLIGMTLFPVLEHQPLPLDSPFFNSGTYHYPFYAFQLVAIAFAAFHSMTVDLFITEVFSIAAIQLKIMNQKLLHTEDNVRRLRGYSEIRREEYTFAYLKECCIHYSDIEEFVENIVELFSVVFFVQLGTSVVAICNAGIIIFTISPISIEASAIYCYLGALFVQLGLYCWFGNDVYFESQQINTACYMSKWYENGPKVRKTLLILMERTKRPLEIKGLGYITLSFTTFLGILKWSYSYFTLLRNMSFEDLQSKVEI